MADTAPPPVLSGLLDLDETFLPIERMRQITRVTMLEDGLIHGEVALGSGHWVFPQHFPADPIFPGSLMIEAAGQLVALWAWAHGHRGRPRLLRATAEFRHPVRPSVTSLTLRAEVREKRNVQFGTISIHAGDLQVGHVEIALAVLRHP
jgi:3-hydroxymyristoyl/3-hydroxydecanoyl-(acyl carrier protein) dehydratase